MMRETIVGRELSTVTFRTLASPRTPDRRSAAVIWPASVTSRSGSSVIVVSILMRPAVLPNFPTRRTRRSRKPAASGVIRCPTSLTAGHHETVAADLMPGRSPPVRPSLLS